MITIKKKDNKVYEVLGPGEKYLGIFYKEIGGYFVFQPDINITGFWTDNALISIGEELKKLNKA